MYCNVEKDIQLSRRPNPVSGHKYQENMLVGLIENGVKIRVINGRRINSYPNYPAIIVCKSRYIFRENILGSNIGFFNLPIISSITKYFSYVLELRRNIEKDKRNLIIVYNSELASCLAALSIRLFYKHCVICNAVGDISGKYGIIHKNGLKNKIIAQLNIICDSLGRKCDCFIFVTKAMAEALNIGEKPFCVIEALYEVKGRIEKLSTDIELENKHEKMVFYSGSLDREYGIAHLLDSFCIIKDKSIKLYIAGLGNAENMVRNYEKKDSRINYLGYISPGEVSKYQAIATVLINPRLPDENYVRFSFPSKTVEYLAAGKPYISHRLPCNPPEYDSYIQYADGTTDVDLANKIQEICDLSEAERTIIGLKGREFIIKYKSPQVQMQKMIKMIDTIKH